MWILFYAIPCLIITSTSSMLVINGIVVTIEMIVILLVENDGVSGAEA